MRTFKNLEKLTIREAGINDIDGIEELQNLEYLDLTGNNIENIESTIKTSWKTAIIAPRLNCHFLNLNSIQKNIINKEKKIEEAAALLISSAIVGPTF